MLLNPFIPSCTKRRGHMSMERTSSLGYSEIKLPEAGVCWNVTASCLL